MERVGIRYDIFLHTYRKDGAYSNEHAKEADIRLDTEEWKLLQPRFSSIESEDDIGGDKGVRFEDYHTHQDFWKTNFETANNVIKSLWSRQQVSRMVQSQGGYDYVIFVRPDCKFYTPLSTRWFARDAIILPDFHRFPVNDRFMILPATHLRMLTSCYDRFLDYSKKYMVHSEIYLAYLLDETPIHKVHMPIRFNRIRADGREEKDV